jgi:hypothetical protein
VVGGEAIIGVVKDDLDVRGEGGGDRDTLMKQSLALLFGHGRVRVGENKTDGGEEIALAGAIPADDNVVTGRKGFDVSLVAVGLEALDGQCFYIHLQKRRWTRDATEALAKHVQVQTVPTRGHVSCRELAL